MLCLNQQAWREAAEGFNHAGEEVMLRGAWEQRQAQKELCSHTSQGPHVDGDVVGGTQDDFRGAVKPGYKKSILWLPAYQGRSHIDDLMNQAHLDWM